MRIAVNTRLLLKGKLEGIGWFTYETLQRIVRNHPEHDFIFIFDRKPDPSFVFAENVEAVVARPQARHPILWYLFFEFGVARILKKRKPDLFLSPDGWLSLRSSVPQLAVIHDLNFESHPAFLPRHIAKYYHHFFPKFARKAARIVTVSEFTKRDLSKRYKIDPAKIDVVYNGANENFHPLGNDEAHSVRKEFTNGKPYFLFVGLIHPRKNLANQLRAFEKFKSESGSEMKFLVVGARHWWSDDLAEIMEKSRYAKDIIFAGRQSIDNLVRIYGAARALLYVSYFEGFGIPILEAFYAEIPVITSTRSSMPEIAGDAGILVKPDDVDGIATAMQSLTSDEKLRSDLVENGRRQREKYNWNRTANALWESIEKVLNRDSNE